MNPRPLWPSVGMTAFGTPALLLRRGLWTMESSSRCGCKTYLLATAGRAFLIDPGPSFQLDVLAREMRASERSLRGHDVLLTHYDWDHTHSAAEWRRRTGATVLLGAADADVLRTGKVPGIRLRRLACGHFGLSELPEGTVELSGEATVADGLRALPTPGHTPVRMRRGPPLSPLHSHLLRRLRARLAAQ